MKIPPLRSGRFARVWAFTLTELIIAIGLVALLASLALPVLASMRERAKAQQCASHLRQSGMLIQTLIADSNNVLKVYYGGDQAADLWTRQLIGRGYVTRAAGGVIFRCPTGKTDPNKPVDESRGGQGWMYECYGMVMMDESAWTWSARTSPFTRWVTLYMANVATPALFPLMADSATFTQGRQFHRIGHKLNNGDSSMALRHQQAANVFFLDGHIEQVDQQRARDLQIPDNYLQIQK